MTTNENARAIDGTVKLVAVAVEHGSRAVERVQLELPARPLDLLQQIPHTAAPARAVQAVHAAVVSATHEVIRTAARATKDAVSSVVASAVANDGANAAASAGPVVDPTPPEEARCSPETPRP